jgi:hypothetical protein
MLLGGAGAAIAKHQLREPPARWAAASTRMPLREGHAAKAFVEPSAQKAKEPRKKTLRGDKPVPAAKPLAPPAPISVATPEPEPEAVEEEAPAAPLPKPRLNPLRDPYPSD